MAAPSSLPTRPGRLRQIALTEPASEAGVTLPSETAVDAEVDLNRGDDDFFLTARLKVSLPGVARDIAQSLIERALQICPYSKMTRGGIEAGVTLA